jgi:cell wall assembly regulator SMI1
MNEDRIIPATNMEFYAPFQPYSPDMLSDLEKKLEVSLPPDYRNFLLQYGGGQPLNTVFESKNENGDVLRKIWIDVFLGNSGNRGSELFSRHAALSDRIPSDFIPVGQDGGGNYICLGISGKNYGKVFMWWKDGEAPVGTKPSYKNMEHIADSFEQFVSNLQPDE